MMFLELKSLAKHAMAKMLSSSLENHIPMLFSWMSKCQASVALKQRVNYCVLILISKYWYSPFAIMICTPHDYCKRARQDISQKALRWMKWYVPFALFMRGSVISARKLQIDWRFVMSPIKKYRPLNYYQSVNYQS